MFSVILVDMVEVDIRAKLRSSSSIKPPDLIISDLKWKYLIRAILRGKNVMMIGPSGCAKTMAARYAAKALDRPFFKFNIGSTQDARATLIGNTTYKKDVGTMFHPSRFVKAITTENAIVLLDELTRGTHEAWNILMTVTDPTQRCLQLDEDENSTVIDIPPSVSFIATANIGNEYTATKVLDKATARRFPVKLEMDHISSEELSNLFGINFKSRTKDQEYLMNQLSEVYEDLIEQCKMEDASITTLIPAANMMEMAELVMDDFNLLEIAECAIYPEYMDADERTFVKSILQKHLPKNIKSPINDPRNK